MVPVADSLSWTTVGLAVGGALLVALVGVVLALLLLRRRTPADRQLEVMQQSTTRVEGMIAGLAGSLEQSQAESARSRHLVEIASTIDLDLVVERVLEATKALPGVDAALLRVDDARGPIAASVGLAPSELATGHEPGSLATGDVRAAVSTYLYTPEREPREPRARERLGPDLGGRHRHDRCSRLSGEGPTTGRQRNGLPPSRTSRGALALPSSTRGGSGKPGSSQTSTR